MKCSIRWLMVLQLVLLLVTPGAGDAQSDGALAGWVGLVSTPVGAFAPTVFVAPMEEGERRVGVHARYGHWQFASDDDNTTNLGLGLAVPAGRGRAVIEVGRTTKKECSECDALMVGVDVQIPVTQRSVGGEGLIVALNPELGYMNATGDSDFSALSAALSVPVSLVVQAGERAQLVPFVTPGLGLGRISAGDESRSGGRVIIGGGLALVGPSSGLQLTAGFSKIIIDGGATVFGVSLGYGR